MNYCIYMGLITYLPWMFMQVLSLDSSVQDDVTKVRRNMLRLIRVGDFSDEAVWHDPCVSFVLPEVICKACNHCRDIDLCKDNYRTTENDRWGTSWCYIAEGGSLVIKSAVALHIWKAAIKHFYFFFFNFLVWKIFQTDQFFHFWFFQNSFCLNFQMLNFPLDNLMPLFSSKTVISVAYVCTCTHTNRFDWDLMACKMVKQWKDVNRHTHPFNACC